MKRSIVGADLGRQALSLAPALQLAREKFRTSPDELLAHAFPDQDIGLCTAALVGDRAGAAPGTWAEFDAADRAQRQRILEAGANAAERVEREGPEADLTPEEQVGLEAIIRFTARPAIVMQGGRFPDPAVPCQGLTTHQPQIAKAASSVGRIQVGGTPEPFLGTGFVVGDNILMTNCHVARRFSVQQEDGSWDLGTGMKPTIDFADNPDADPSLEFDITEILGVRPGDDTETRRLKVWSAIRLLGPKKMQLGQPAAAGDTGDVGGPQKRPPDALRLTRRERLQSSLACDPFRSRHLRLAERAQQVLRPPTHQKCPRSPPNQVRPTC